MDRDRSPAPRPDEPGPRPDEVDPAVLKTYEGTYDGPNFGVTITLKDGKLTGVATDGGAASPWLPASALPAAATSRWSLPRVAC